jgi:hypothetical protein
MRDMPGLLRASDLEARSEKEGILGSGNKRRWLIEIDAVKGNCPQGAATSAVGMRFKIFSFGR